jgi:hypothetical protein
MVHTLLLAVSMSDARSGGLASGAEAGPAVLHRDALHGEAANGAGFASPMSNPKIAVGRAQVALVFYSPDALAGLEFPAMSSSCPGSIPS